MTFSAHFVQNRLLPTVLALMLYGCNGDDATTTTSNEPSQSSLPRGSLLMNSRELENITPTMMTTLLDMTGTPHGAYAFGYRAIKIVYTTVDQAGNEVNASGLIVIPTTDENYPISTPYQAAIVSEHHGTLFDDQEAPSNLELTNGQPDNDMATLYSSIYGYITVMPDYIGFGESVNQPHPYILQQGSANASLDMLKAATTYLDQQQIGYNGKLYLSGYSEGGYVTMALAKTMQTETVEGLELTAVAPMAGPYDVEQTVFVNKDDRFFMRLNFRSEHLQFSP